MKVSTLGSQSITYACTLHLDGKKLIILVQLLGLVGPGKDAQASAAVMDLGGASTQIVFEPSFPENSKLSPGDHVYDLSFAVPSTTLSRSPGPGKLL